MNLNIIGIDINRNILNMDIIFVNRSSLLGSGNHSIDQKLVEIHLEHSFSSPKYDLVGIVSRYLALDRKEFYLDLGVGQGLDLDLLGEIELEDVNGNIVHLEFELTMHQGGFRDRRKYKTSQ